MTAWFIFAALVGWPLVAISVLFGDSTDAGAETADPAPAGDGAAGSSPVSVVGSFLTVAATAFFAAFFGLTGLLLTWLGTPAGVTVVSAVAIGVFAGWFHGMLIRWLQRTGHPGSLPGRRIAGRPATVAVPLAEGVKGRVAVDLEGQHLSYVALPYRRDDTVYEVGSIVVVVEVERGVALVAPMDDLG